MNRPLNSPLSCPAQGLHPSLSFLRAFKRAAAACVLAAGPVFAADAPAVPQLPMPSGQTYTVLAGETLDRVIRKTMADSPLKIELIREAFVKLNPQAFTSGQAGRLKKGAVLHIPDNAQLLRQLVLPVLESAEAAAMPRDGTPQSADDRRRWVRFP